ncbi:MAG: hypothetical protein ACOCQQ_01135 [Candidatus Nanoarchaeia archaeon]
MSNKVLIFSITFILFALSVVAPVQALAEANFVFVSPVHLETYVGSELNLTIQLTALREDANCTYRLFTSDNSPLTQTLVLPKEEDQLFSTTLHFEESGDYKVTVSCLRADHPSVDKVSYTPSFSVDFECLEGESFCEDGVLTTCENGFFTQETCAVGCDDKGLSCAQVIAKEPEDENVDDFVINSTTANDTELSIDSSSQPVVLKRMGLVLLVVGVYLFVMWFLHRRPKGE